MSDYQNSDTAKWDADQVRRQTGETQKAAKGKKKRRFGWLIYLACVIVGSCLLAGLGWLAVNDVCALNKAPLTATIEVESGDSVGTVATKLKKAGLIDSKLLFMITSPVFHASRYIQPGVYELNTDMDFNCLIKSMQPTGGVAATVTVTIPEGYTVEQIIQLLAENDVSDAAALEESAKNHVFDKFDFVDNENLGSVSRLEGYLFPDTYEFYVKENADSALSRLLSNFQDRIMDDPDIAPLLANSSYSLKEIVIMASLIEKETDGTDRAVISSVIHNRLENVGETAHLLQIDASLVYAAGREITEDDYQTLDSPYNLYTHQGLPPTAIANAGFFMEEGGVFLFDMNTPYKHQQVLGENAFTFEEEDASCVWRNHYSAEDRRVEITVDIDYRETGEHFHEQFYEYTYDLAAIRAALERHGFVLESVCDGETFGPLTEESERYFFCAVKQYTQLEEQ